MKSNKAFEKVKMLYNRVRVLLKWPSRRFSRLKSEISQEPIKLAFKRPHSLAYQLIGEKTERVLPLFRDLDSNLQRDRKSVV